MPEYVITMAAGLALGFGIASVVYMGVFIRTLKELHRDNVLTAELLLTSDFNRTTQTQEVAGTLKQSDTHVVRKVEEQGNGDGTS